MDSSFSLPPRLEMHAQFVSDLLERTVHIMESYEVFFSSVETLPAVIGWMIETAVKEGVPVAELIYTFKDLDKAADQIAHKLLLDIAEERPGSDPWEHEPTVPVHIALVGTLLHSLNICVNLALGNHDDGWALYCLALSGKISSGMAEQLMTHDKPEEKEIVIDYGNHMLMKMNGIVIYYPQSGLAATARILEGTALRLEKTLWKVGDEMPQISEMTASNLRKEAHILRGLTGAYGSQTGPREGS